MDSLPNELIYSLLLSFCQGRPEGIVIISFVSKLWLEFAKSLGKFIRYNSDEAIRGIFSFCRVPLLEWSVNSGCPVELNHATHNLQMFKTLAGMGYEYNDYTLRKAVADGNLEVVKYARENGCPWGECNQIRSRICGFPLITCWLRNNGCPFGLS